MSVKKSRRRLPQTCIEYDIYVYLNYPHLALDDRTSTGIANAMRISKDTAGDKLKSMVDKGLLEMEPVGTSKLYFINFQERE